MSLKVIACLLAAVLVTAGGAYVYHGGESHCGGCPLGLMSGKTDSCEACTDAPAASCCETKPVAAKLSCCEESCCDAKPADSATAGLGGAFSAARSLK